jgi:Calx-beta domain
MLLGRGDGPRRVPAVDALGGQVGKIFRRLAVLLAVLGGVATTVVSVAAGPAQAACDTPRLVSVEGVRAAEGTSVEQGRFTSFEFAVTSSSCPLPGTLRYETVPYSAREADFVPRSGELSFKPGDLGKQTVTVQVIPDSEPEANECFSVRLSKPTGQVRVGTAEAPGIVVNDDRQSAKGPLGQIFICSE